MIDFTVNSWIKIEHFSFLYHVTVERFFAHCCHQNYRFCEETWEINSDNIVYLCSSRLVQCYLLIFKIISIYNWSKVGIVYCKMGGGGEPRNSKNLPRWAAEFGKRRCGIWQNLPQKTVGPSNLYAMTYAPVAFHASCVCVCVSIGNSRRLLVLWCGLIIIVV